MRTGAMPHHHLSALGARRRRWGGERIVRPALVAFGGGGSSLGYWHGLTPAGTTSAPPASGKPRAARSRAPFQRSQHGDAGVADRRCTIARARIEVAPALVTQAATGVAAERQGRERQQHAFAQDR